LFNSKLVEQLSQLFLEAVTQSRFNLKKNYENYTRQLYNTHNLSIDFSFTSVGLINKNGNKTI